MSVSNSRGYVDIHCPTNPFNRTQQFTAITGNVALLRFQISAPIPVAAFGWKSLCYFKSESYAVTAVADPVPLGC